MPKYLLTFEKGEPVRWLGHLDIHRTFERAIRRAALPIAFSAGFNPREKLAFGAALSLGVTGDHELLSLELTEPLPPSEVCQNLNNALPPGIRIHACRELTDTEAKSVVSSLHAAELRVVCVGDDDLVEAQVQTAVIALLSSTEMVIRREREGKAKSVDIRPALFHLEVQPDSVAGGRFTLRMIVGQGGDLGTARPSEVVDALSAHLPGIRVKRAHRARLFGVPEVRALFAEAFPCGTLPTRDEAVPEPVLAVE